MKSTENFCLQRRVLEGFVILGILAVAFSCSGESQIEQPTPLFGEMTIDYPLNLWDQDIEGETLLRVRVTETGAVDSVEIFGFSGYRAFDSAAVAGATGLLFNPATRDGKRIGVWVTLPVQFSKRPLPDTEN
ncbi:MAG TPA: energy transducer TonB [Gemmatimonadetes bacterium]|nr:energy transducer TonB [Gemmatimonadota bacterium]